MKQAILIFILALPILTQAQGIKFEEGLSWEQVKKKAKKENKYIFADCYTTWCVPCKKMEKEVFSKKSVGDFVNANFISVRIQMDTAKADNEYIKSWYKQAGELNKHYKIKSFPSYLFFSPDGKIVHRYLYALPDSAFMKIAKDAISEDRQYFTLLGKYRSGTIDNSKLYYLATISKQIGQDSLAANLAKDYNDKYINAQPEGKLLDKKYLEFIDRFHAFLTSGDKIFKVMAKDESKADSIMNYKGFAASFVQYVIEKEEINPQLWPGNKAVHGTVNWTKLEAAVRKKYNSYHTGNAVLNAKMKWYSEKNDTAQVISCWIRKNDQYGLDTAGIRWVYFNNFAWEYVFLHATNKDTLKKVADWIYQIIQQHPGDFTSIDTYANLLYKAGRKEEAIDWEKKAVFLETELAKKEKREPDLSYQEALNKMQKGLPTWN